MKNKLYYVFVLFMCFVFTGGVYAEGVSITLEGNVNNVNKGESTEITVKLTSDKVISSCQFKIESTEGLAFVTGSDDIPPNSWGKTGNITDGYTLTRPGGEEPAVPNGGILKLGYTVNDSGTITIKNIKCIVEEDSSEQELEDKTLSITAVDPVDDTSLKSLVVRNGSTVPVGPGIESGATKISTSNFGLEIETNNPDYQDKVVVKDKDGNIINDIKNITFSDPTGQALMLLFIIVNDSKPYELSVKYEQIELDNSLKYIKINGIDIYENGKISYVYEIENNVNDVLVEIALTDSENFKIGEFSNIDLETLKRTFTVNVEEFVNIIIEPKDSSSGGQGETYLINIKRKGAQAKPDETEEPSGIEKPTQGNNGNVETNPTTGDISMFFMILILISSLIVSVILYRKNLESYK